MQVLVETLEQRVADAVRLIASLREQTATLARELAVARAALRTEDVPPAQPFLDPALVEELDRLRAERVLVRERVRGLLREIDRVTW